MVVPFSAPQFSKKVKPNWGLGITVSMGILGVNINGPGFMGVLLEALRIVLGFCFSCSQILIISLT